MGFEPTAMLPTLDVVLPDGCIDLLINTGPTFKRIDNLSSKDFLIKDYALIGQRKNAVEISQTVDTTFFAIRFTPFGMKSLFPFDSSELTGTMIDLDRSIKNVVDPIRSVLEKKITFQEKLIEIEEVLESKITNTIPSNFLVEKATSEILNGHGNFNVSEFCSKEGIHKSTLEKNFLSYVGLSPKEFAAIIRFNRAHSLLQKEGKIKLTHLALDCGYYDQSHMIKEFKRFSNSSPSKLIKAQYLLPTIAASCYYSLQS